MATPLMNWIEGLLHDPDAREAFLNNPDGYAQDHGFHNISSADVHDALSLIADADHSNFSHGVHYPPPQQAYHQGGDDGTHYLRGYFKENETAIERHHSDLDNSVDQRIDTGGRDYHHGHHHFYDGGDFNQAIDNDPVVASGDGAVGTGGAITNDTVTSGDDNLVGSNDQAVTGHHDATDFGAGDATGIGTPHAALGNGGALGVRGDSVSHDEDNDTATSVHNSGPGDNAVNSAGDHGYSDQHSDQTYHDNSARSDYEDSSRTDTHNETDSHNDGRYHDSHTIDVHH
ncbi:MAG: IniB N-terminal domain-containing protein [Pseudonocardia sp.]|nr:IniB N-terminal domain-containing protein [Pseudonocardia sp.]